MARKTKARGPSRRTRTYDLTDVRAFTARSMPRGDAGTPEREAIDELLRGTATFSLIGNDGHLHISTEEARREVIANGVIFRYAAGAGLCDAHMMPAGPASNPMSEFAMHCRPRLYGFGKPVEWEVDEKAYSHALSAEQDLDRKGEPENARVFTARIFRCHGSSVMIMRAPRGRFPTPWVIADVRPAGPAGTILVDQSIVLEAACRIAANC